MFYSGKFINGELVSVETKSVPNLSKGFMVIPEATAKLFMVTLPAPKRYGRLRRFVRKLTER